MSHLLSCHARTVSLIFESTRKPEGAQDRVRMAASRYSKRKMHLHLWQKRMRDQTALTVTEMTSHAKYSEHQTQKQAPKKNRQDHRRFFCELITPSVR